ncbi:MAG TPA: ClbS/DfsB family four-helix bundle protein [Roseiflexaceae bacterium]
MDDATEYTATPASKAELIEWVRREHAALEETIDRLTEAQMTAPVDGGWSIKDILAHITAWEQVLVLFHMGGRPFDEAAGLDTITYGTDDTEQINDALYRRDRDKPLPDVLAAFRRSYEQALAAIEATDEADLFKPYTPRGRTAADTGPLIDWIASDTYEHYVEHRLMIQALAAPGA